MKLREKTTFLHDLEISGIIRIYLEKTRNNWNSRLQQKILHYSRFSSRIPREHNCSSFVRELSKMQSFTWEECLQEKQVWQSDYAERKAELDEKWANEKASDSGGGDAGDWKRLERNDKERFLDDFCFEINNRTICLEQMVANAPGLLGLTIWDGVSESRPLCRLFGTEKQSDGASLLLCWCWRVWCWASI